MKTIFKLVAVAVAVVAMVAVGAAASGKVIHDDGIGVSVTR